MQYFEDIVPGTKQAFGAYPVTREEVMAFAKAYDPQPFHLSDEAAATTHFGRLSASGWHTCAMTMAMLVANLEANEQAGLGSPGIEDLQWLKPVYPGDTLRCETEILDKRASSSRGDDRRHGDRHRDGRDRGSRWACRHRERRSFRADRG